MGQDLCQAKVQKEEVEKGSFKNLFSQLGKGAVPCLSDEKLCTLLSGRKDAGVGTVSTPGVVSGAAATMHRHS